jgi:hypothetical protein
LNLSREAGGDTISKPFGVDCGQFPMKDSRTAIRADVRHINV